MKFIDRQQEMRRLLGTVEAEGAGLVVVWGRRRLGKSRLLTEWCKQTNGAYWVADESAPAIQRQYLAEELAAVFPGFAEASYSDWTVLLNRLSREARNAGWRGPLVLDEFPYLVSGAPELPSILQKWIDREKREGGLTLALSGSSQRMMMDSILNSEAPLYGRADQILKIEPLLPGYTDAVVENTSPQSLLDFYTCWGGVPRYWELAQPFKDNPMQAVDDLVLSPLGVLHDEVERLLRQEMPSAIPLRPILDAIGLGAHRSSEIAARLQTSSTSLPRGLKQLQQLGYIHREIPYGENEKRSKKALYRLADPFLRLWFSLVAPHRGSLKMASKSARIKLLQDHWGHLRAQAWEEICRLAIPRMRLFDREWHPAARYWKGTQGEWDVVSTSLDGKVIILGECKSLARPAEEADIDRIVRTLMAKPEPECPGSGKQRRKYVICVPVAHLTSYSPPSGITVLDGNRLFAALVQEKE